MTKHQKTLKYIKDRWKTSDDHRGRRKFSYAGIGLQSIWSEPEIIQSILTQSDWNSQHISSLTPAITQISTEALIQ